MSSVLDLPSGCSRLSERDWTASTVTTVSPRRATLVGQDLALRRSTFKFPERTLVVESTGPLPIWFERAIESLVRLAQLPVNWDSYSAEAIGYRSILATVELLSAILRDTSPFPFFVPTNRGTVLLEWHTHGIDLEIEVVGRGQAFASFEDSNDGTKWEIAIGSDLTPLVECIERLTKRN